MATVYKLLTATLLICLLVTFVRCFDFEEMLFGFGDDDFDGDFDYGMRPITGPRPRPIPTPQCNTHVTAKGLKCRCDHPCGRHGVSNVWCYTNDKDWAWCCKMPCNAKTKKCYGSEHWWGRRDFDCNPSQNTCSVSPGACVTETTFRT